MSRKTRSFGFTAGSFIGVALAGSLVLLSGQLHTRKAGTLQLSETAQQQKLAEPRSVGLQSQMQIEPTRQSRIVQAVAFRTAYHPVKPKPTHKVHRHTAQSNTAVHKVSTKPVPAQVVSRSASVLQTGRSDLYWMSHIIHAEAANEPFRAQVAVGDVIMNRVHSSSYPNTIKSVIFQISGGHYQFTPVLNGYIYSTPDSASMKAAEEVLHGVNILPNAFVYYTPSKTPATSWVRKQPTITTIGHFVFAK